MTDKFHARCLKITYKLLPISPEHAETCRNSIKDALESAFNRGYQMKKSYCLIYVPTNCNYFEILNAVTSEFRKHAPLKGMRYRIDLWERMKEI